MSLRGILSDTFPTQIPAEQQAREPKPEPSALLRALISKQEPTAPASALLSALSTKSKLLHTVRDAFKPLGPSIKVVPSPQVGEPHLHPSQPQKSLPPIRLWGSKRNTHQLNQGPVSHPLASVFSSQQPPSLESYVEQQVLEEDMEAGAPAIHNTNNNSGSAQPTLHQLTNAATPTINRVTQETNPLRVMMFVDTTWVIYRLREVYGLADPESLAHALLQFPGTLKSELERKFNFLRNTREVDIQRVLAFGSYGLESDTDHWRKAVSNRLKGANWEIHFYELPKREVPVEKCVDISLATELLHYSTVKGAFDMAVAVIGDADYQPALRRAIQNGARICIASFSGACSRALYYGQNDVDILWLDNLVDITGDDLPNSELVGMVHNVIIDYVNEHKTNVRAAPLREVASQLARHKHSSIINRKFGSLLKFLQHHPQCFVFQKVNGKSQDILVTLRS
jgi:hypothetical protein